MATHPETGLQSNRIACLPPPNTHERMPASSLNIPPPCLSTARWQRRLSLIFRAHPKTKHNIRLTTPKRIKYESNYVEFVVVSLDVFCKLIWMEYHCESRRSFYQILVVSRDDVNIKSAHAGCHECLRFRRDGLTFEKDRMTTTMTTESVFSQ